MAANSFHILHIAFMVSLLFNIIGFDLINAQSITQAEFQENPVNNDDRALFRCRVYNRGSNYVSIERSIFSRTEPLTVDKQVLQAVADNVYLSVFDNDDGSETYSLSIRGVYHLYDAATYTCKIETTAGQVVTMRSTELYINYNPDSNYDPRCSIVGSDSLSRTPGTEIRLGCHSALGYPPVYIAWSYRGCSEGRTLPQPQVTNSGAYYSEIRVTLTEEDNGGEFICTISRPDKSFSSSCNKGPFMISGGEDCVVMTTTTEMPSTAGSPSNSTTLSRANGRFANWYLHVIGIVVTLFTWVN